MLDMDIKYALVGVVEGFLPKFSPKTVGLFLSIDLREEDVECEYVKKKESSTATIIRFIIQRPHNYTKVLVNYDFNNYRQVLNPPKIQEYELQANHDSAWRDDGFRIFNNHWANVSNYYGVHPSKINNFYNIQKVSYIRFSMMDEIVGKKRPIYKVSFDFIDQKELISMLEYLNM